MRSFVLLEGIGFVVLEVWLGMDMGTCMLMMKYTHACIAGGTFFELRRQICFRVA